MLKSTAAIAFLSGFIFALGLGLSGMTQPQKVVGFLDVFGQWDPSLMAVMVGAIAVNAAYFWLLKPKTPHPVCAPSYQLPTVTRITPRLVLGSALFGIGWALAGFCPGPAVTALASFTLAPWLFVGAMLVGMAVYRLTVKPRKRS